MASNTNMAVGPFGKSLFTGGPVEYAVLKGKKVVAVADFFASDLTGGAELTTEAILSASPHSVARLHSTSLTVEMIEANLDKIWIIFNFAQMQTGVLQCLHHYAMSGELKYYVVEYDYKYCRFRSAHRHMMEAKEPCDCKTSAHGRAVAELYSHSKKTFWMSEGQLGQYKILFPNTFGDNQLVLSSVFAEATIAKLRKLRAKFANKEDKFSFLGGGSWIKGSEQTEAWCKLNKKSYTKIENLPYDKFLEELAKYKTFVFMPLDLDTCPRVTIEAKLLGCELQLNNKVQHRSEEWFSGSIEGMEEYLLSRPKFFWDNVEV